MPKAKAPITPYQNVYKFPKIPVINTKNAIPDNSFIMDFPKLEIFFLLVFIFFPFVTLIPPNPISTSVPSFSLTLMPLGPIVTSSSPSLTCIPPSPIFTVSLFLLSAFFSSFFSTLIVTSFPALLILISTFSSSSFITTFSSSSLFCFGGISLSTDTSGSSLLFFYPYFH